jgi:hypothetical protein
MVQQHESIQTALNSGDMERIRAVLIQQGYIDAQASSERMAQVIQRIKQRLAFMDLQ